MHIPTNFYMDLMFFICLEFFFTAFYNIFATIKAFFALIKAY